MLPAGSLEAEIPRYQPATSATFLQIQLKNWLQIKFR
jgi:hypothetical protein